MADELLPYYNRELLYIRRLAGEFADANPKIAGRLRLSADAVEDPHVARLIEAFAYLNARIRLKLDDDFPELTDALLGTLYPHYLAPIPSMAIARFMPAPDMDGSFTLPVGAELDTEPVAGEACRYRSCYPVELWPIALEGVRLTGLPLVAPQNPRAGRAVASLRLTLRCLADGVTFTQLAPDRLRFFLSGQPQQVYPLYELLFCNAVSVALADGVNDPDPVILDASCIRPVGFGSDEGMLPYPARSLPGYRLLTEFFAFPEKFLFFDLVGLNAKTLMEAGERLEVFIYLDRGSSELERSLGPENLLLGCAPVVNLFRQRAEPIELTQTDFEYRVVADVRRPAAMEVYSIDAVRATSPSGERRDFLPFYDVKHASGVRSQPAFWHASRRPTGKRDPGTDVFLSIVDLDFNPAAPSDWVLSIDTTCVNRDLPSQLPFGGGHPHLKLTEGVAAIATVSCVTPPTGTLRPPAGNRARWRILSHLSLNHLSLTDDELGPDALREILRLYDFRDSPETRAIIDGVVSVSHRRTVARAPGQAFSAFCRGIEVSVEFDTAAFAGSGLFLLAAVLERFLALYGSINAFTQMVAKVKGRPGVLKRWPPRAGDQPLL